jgi:hypothetical protein
MDAFFLVFFRIVKKFFQKLANYLYSYFQWIRKNLSYIVYHSDI